MTRVWTSEAMTQEQERRVGTKARILAALQDAGPAGLTNGDLNTIAFRYGGRIHELRKAGHTIEAIDEGEGRWRFVLHPPTPAVVDRWPVLEPEQRDGFLF